MGEETDENVRLPHSKPRPSARRQPSAETDGTVHMVESGHRQSHVSEEALRWEGLLLHPWSDARHEWKMIRWSDGESMVGIMWTGVSGLSCFCFLGTGS